jgi:acyl-CoA synthetase (AMP-forming)/AMP-acid ligase II
MTLVNPTSAASARTKTKAVLNGQPSAGIVAANSIAFVEETFKAYDEGRCLITLRSARDGERLGLFGDLATIEPELRTGWARSKFKPTSKNVISQIVFSSGTSGTPKAIALTAANIADATRRLVAAMELTHEVREYVGAPAHYSFGLGRCRAVSAVGGEYYLPPHGFDPIEIAAMLKAGEINAISAVPTLWRLVLQNPELFSAHGGAVRWIEVGSQFMSREEKEGLKALFPNAVILQHYGLTEASRTTFLRIDKESGEALDSVGRVAGGTKIKLAEDGRVMIRGAHVATWLLGPDGLSPLTDADGWLTTNDVGSIRDGLLFYEGRTDNLINCGGVKASAESVEAVLHRALGTSDVDLAVSKIPDLLRGEGVLVSFVPRGGLNAETVAGAATGAADAAGIAATAIKIQSVMEIPLTETGKIRRHALSDLYAAGAPAPATGYAISTDAAGIEAQLLAIWREALARDDVSVDQGFYDVGGDSLSAVTVALGMERAGFPPEVAQGIFDGMTIAELARAATPAHANDAEAPQATKTEVARLSEASNFVKGIVFLCMVSSHWAPVYLLQIGHRAGLPGAVLAPIFSLGSPTLAFAFGLGVAVFHLRQQETSPAAFRRNVRISALLLAAGILVGGVMDTLEIGLTKGTTAQAVIVRLLTSGPFIYYFLAAASLPLWVKHLRRDMASILRVLLVAVASYGVYEALRPILPLVHENEPMGGLAQVLVGHWSLFQMAAITLLGVGAGLGIEARLREGGRLPSLFPVGLLMAAGGVVMSAASGTLNSWFVFPKLITLPGVLFYAGLAVMLIGGFERLTAAIAGKPVLRGAVDLVCCLGILLFPLYVAQSVVYNAASIAAHFTGLPLYLPLTGMIAAFVAVMAVPLWRVYRLYYQGRR